MILLNERPHLPAPTPQLPRYGSDSFRISAGRSVSFYRIAGFFPVGDAAGVPAYMLVPTLRQKVVRALAGRTWVAGAIDHDLVLRSSTSAASSVAGMLREPGMCLAR